MGRGANSNQLKTIANEITAGGGFKEVSNNDGYPQSSILFSDVPLKTIQLLGIFMQPPICKPGFSNQNFWKIARSIGDDPVPQHLNDISFYIHHPSKKKLLAWPGNFSVNSMFWIPLVPNVTRICTLPANQTLKNLWYFDASKPWKRQDTVSARSALRSFPDLPARSPRSLGLPTRPAWRSQGGRGRSGARDVCWCFILSCGHFFVKSLCLDAWIIWNPQMSFVVIFSHCYISYIPKKKPEHSCHCGPSSPTLSRLPSGKLT